MMTRDDVRTEYDAKRQSTQEAMWHAQSKQTATLLTLGVSLALLLGVGVLAISQRAPVWFVLLAIPIAVGAYWQHSRHSSAPGKLRRLGKFYQRGQERLKEEWRGKGFTGEEYLPADHPYAADLNLFGDGSLFEILCQVRTEIGRDRLADYLLARPPLAEILARQEAVQELTANTKLREEIALLGQFDFLESSGATFSEWLAATPAQFPAMLRWLTLASSSLLLLLLAIVLTGSVSFQTMWPWMIPILLWHGGVGSALRDLVTTTIESGKYVGAEISIVREGLALMERQQFRSPKLQQLTQQVAGSARTVQHLEWLFRALRERNYEWFYLPSFPFLAGSQLCLAIEHWRTQHGPALRNWLTAWAEFEALCALAGYAYEQPADVFPRFTEHETAYQALALGHPLLPAETCVRNDITLDSKTRFYLISGSNMAGKSTLLRSIGTNAVLAFAGAPVRAQQLVLSPCELCASVSVADSLLHGKSKFLAEVQRLRYGIEVSSANSPVLFLIDEIFSGTNSRDRLQAAEAVLSTLIHGGAIGALSTHDLALTQIAERDDLHGTNVHMRSRNGEDPLDFDYLIKPGVTPESNALAIARLAGVPV